VYTLIKKDADGHVMLTKNDAGEETIIITDDNGEDLDFNPEKSNSYIKKIQSENKEYRTKKKEWKDKAIDLEKNYNSINGEYKILKDKDSSIDDKMTEMRQTISKEFEDKYNPQIDVLKKENTAIKRQRTENDLLKSKVLQSTTFDKTDYIRNFGEFVNDDGTFNSRNGQVLYDPKNPENKITDIEHAMEIIVKTHPAGDAILKSVIKSGFGSSNDNSADVHQGVDEKLTLADFDKVLSN
jgi:hypothetical protein